MGRRFTINLILGFSLLALLAFGISGGSFLRNPVFQSTVVTAFIAVAFWQLIIFFRERAIGADALRVFFFSGILGRLIAAAINTGVPPLLALTLAILHAAPSNSFFLAFSYGQWVLSAWVEEYIKYYAARFVWFKRFPRFDWPFRYYVISSAIGFAVFERIFAIIEADVSRPASSFWLGIAVFLVAIGVHSVFTSITGWAAITSRNKKNPSLIIGAGIGFAAGIHALFNLFAVPYLNRIFG